MFLLTQFIGLYVVGHYTKKTTKLPYGMETPSIEKKSDYYTFFSGIIFAFVFAILVLFFLTRFDLSFLIRIWFFFVIVIALGVSFNSFLSSTKCSSIIALAISLPLAFFKIYKNNFIIHNLTELLIYPGIAAIFVPLLNPFTVVLFLILISLYDMWAVWHSGIMQKMAQYQINKLKVFSGFFIPYLSKKQKKLIKKAKSKKNADKKIKVDVAILGGGDIIFPIITAGVFLANFGLSYALFVIGGATIGLTGLFIFSEKKKFYPAMPFITGGIFLGIMLSYLLL